MRASHSAALAARKNKLFAATSKKLPAAANRSCPKVSSRKSIRKKWPISLPTSSLRPQVSSLPHDLGSPLPPVGRRWPHASRADGANHRDRRANGDRAVLLLHVHALVTRSDAR